MNAEICERWVSELPRSRFKVEVRGEGGERIAITVDGRLSREKVVQVLDFVDLIGKANEEGTREAEGEMTKFDRLRFVLSRKFPMGWFTSQDAMIAYEDVFNEPLGLSTVSTYLARFAEQGALVRSGSSAMRRYRKRKAIKGSEREVIES